MALLLLIHDQLVNQPVSWRMHSRSVCERIAATCTRATFSTFKEAETGDIFAEVCFWARCICFLTHWLWKILVLYSIAKVI